MYVNVYFNAQQGIKKNFMYREDFENERILDSFFYLRCFLEGMKAKRSKFLSRHFCFKSNVKCPVKPTKEKKNSNAIWHTRFIS